MADEYKQKGIDIKVYWYFDEDDNDMLEAGQDISKMVNVPMEFVSVTSKIVNCWIFLQKNFEDKKNEVYICIP